MCWNYHTLVLWYISWKLEVWNECTLYMDITKYQCCTLPSIHIDISSLGNKMFLTFLNAYLYCQWYSIYFCHKVPAFFLESLAHWGLYRAYTCNEHINMWEFVTSCVSVEIMLSWSSVGILKSVMGCASEICTTSTTIAMYNRQAVQPTCTCTCTMKIAVLRKLRQYVFFSERSTSPVIKKTRQSVSKKISVLFTALKKVYNCMKWTTCICAEYR